MKGISILAVLSTIVFTISATAERRPSIIGGEIVKDEKLRQATVWIDIGNAYNEGFCSGAYIGHNHVMTAEHCLQAGRIQSVDFLLGDTVHECQAESSPAIQGYKGFTKTPEKDLQRLTVHCPDLDLSNWPSFEIAPSNQLPANVPISIAGYGLPDIRGNPTFPELRQIHPDKLYDFSGDTGNVALKPYLDQVKAGNEICYAASNESSFYEGDSGGPVFYTDSNGNYVLIGVVSTFFADEDNYNLAANCLPMIARFHDCFSDPNKLTKGCDDPAK